MADERANADAEAGAPQPPGEAPPGLAPRNLEALFTAGARLTDPEHGLAVVSEPEQAGLLHLTTGSVVAADPGSLSRRDTPFTVTVAPGRYPVAIGRIRWQDKGWSEVTAARITVRDEPVATWELALRPGQDPDALRRRGYYGFDVDTGSGAFLDAAGRDRLAALYRSGLAAALAAAEPSADAPCGTWVQDPETGANLVAFPGGRGDGTYPVWIGRGPTGQVACLVADLLVLHGAEPLSPGPLPAARHIAPPPAVAAPA